jgi:hypothetical protein
MEARAQNATPVLTTIGVDIGKDVFHIVGFGADVNRGTKPRPLLQTSSGSRGACCETTKHSICSIPRSRPSEPKPRIGRD